MSDFKDLLSKSRGYDAFAKREEEIEARMSSFVNRFWLPVDGEAKIVFLDDEPPIIEEHQIKIDGDWRNWFTCLRLVGESCPICESTESRPYTVGFYTVLDMSEWTDRRGNTHKNELKLLPAKFKTLQQLKKLSAKRGSLKGACFEVYRTTKDSPNTGDVFDFVDKMSKEEILELNPNATPFDYAEILEPKSASEILAVLKKATKDSHDEDESDSRIDW